MKCANLVQATAVSMVTMNRMSEADYHLFEPFGGSQNWHIAKVNDADETFYTLTPNGNAFACTCPFHVANGVCKHDLYLQREIAFRAWIAEVETTLAGYDAMSETEAVMEGAY